MISHTLLSSLRTWQTKLLNIFLKTSTLLLMNCMRLPLSFTIFNLDIVSVKLQYKNICTMRITRMHTEEDTQKYRALICCSWSGKTANGDELLNHISLEMKLGSLITLEIKQQFNEVYHSKLWQNQKNSRRLHHLKIMDTFLWDRIF